MPASTATKQRTESRGGRTSRSAGHGANGLEHKIFGVPERFMRPRLTLIAVVFVLMGFGMLMIYSASSVSALNNTVTDVNTGGDAAYFLKRQAIFAVIGLVVAVIIALFDYRLWSEKLLIPLWALSIVLLLIVRFGGAEDSSANGASRWITILGFRLQPSEFVKIVIILTAANLADQYFERGTITQDQFWKGLFVGVVVPVGLILIQPDKGTTLVIGLTLLVMGYLAGLPPKLVLGALVVCGVVFLAWSLKDDYSRTRFLIMFDPWQDAWDSGYHLIQGWYAFGSGGLLGTGIGYSRQKYSYLPESYNDFIFAVIGEECGFVGTVCVLALFALFVWAGFKIAQHASDMSGRLVAAGSTSLIGVQLLLNVCGVLGLFPLSGKPIPFLSYGGSSIIASLMLVGLIVSVSRHSVLPETAADRARRSLTVEEPAAGRGFELVGEAHPRSERGRSSLLGGASEVSRGTSRGSSDGSGRSGFSVVSGGRDLGRNVGRGASGSSGTSGGRQRIDLGPSATERLRGKR